MYRSKYEQHVNGQVQGVVFGENNTITLIYQNGKRRVIPFSAPPRPPHTIIGRKRTLQDLKQRLFAEHIIALYGLPGVGKSALAVELAHDKEVLSHFEDGVLWVGLGRKGNILSVLGSMAIALGMPSAQVKRLDSIEERARAINAAIGMRHILVVADDAWTLEAALAMRFSGPNCGKIVTTRLPQIALNVAGAEAIAVEELNWEDGLALLSQFVPNVAGEQTAKTQILIEAVGGLPLAIVLIGRYLQKEAYSAQPKRLEEALGKLEKAEERMRLTQPQTPFDHHPSLPVHVPVSLLTVISISYEALDEASRRTLQALAIFPSKPNSFSGAAAMAVSSESSRTLGVLIDYGLLESEGSGRYTLHQTISDFARNKIKDSTISERMVKFFVNYVSAHKNDYGNLDVEINNILASLQEASRLGMHASLIEGTNSLYQFLETRGMYDVADLYLGLAQQAAVSINDPIGLTTVLLNLGRVAERRGIFTSAKMHWSEALDTARKTGNLERVSIVLMNLGGLLCRLSETKKAEEHLLEGLRLAREIGHQERISTILNNLGNVPFSRGDVDDAEKHWLDALDIARKLEDPMIISHPLTNLGILEYMRGNIGKAEIYLRESLDLARKVQHLERISDLLLNLGVMEYMGERFKSAEDYWREALDTAQKIGIPDTVSKVLGNLAIIEYDRGNFAKAEIHWLDALGVARRLGQPNSIGCLLGNLGEIAMKRGNLKRAELYLSEGLSLVRKSGEPYGIAGLLKNVGEMEHRRGNFAKAQEYLLEALGLARGINQPQSTIETLGSLGEMEYMRGNFVKSEEYLTEALDLARKIKNCQLISNILIKWGKHHLRQHRPRLAYPEFREAMEMAKSRKELIGHALYGLALVAFKQGDFAKARGRGQESLAIFRAMGHCLAEEVLDWLSRIPKG